MKTNEQPAILRATQCFAHDGYNDSIIDMINPDTGLSFVCGENLEQIRTRYPDAVIREFDELTTEKAREQDAPGEWLDCTEERYWDALNVLPPAARNGGGFLLGEAQDHHSRTGRPRFSCYRKSRDGETFATYSKPITFAQFCEFFGPSQYFYN